MVVGCSTYVLAVLHTRVQRKPRKERDAYVAQDPQSRDRVRPLDCWSDLYSAKNRYEPPGFALVRAWGCHRGSSGGLLVPPKW